MRLATFNAENLFKRPRIMRYPTWREGKEALKDFATLSSLVEEISYSPGTKTKLACLESIAAAAA